MSDTVWKGPQEDGVTQSLMNKFYACRERFRLLTVHGLQEPRIFDKTIQFGQMWHECEEAHAGGQDWKKALRKYSSTLVQNFPRDVPDITKWVEICKR